MTEAADSETCAERPEGGAVVEEVGCVLHPGGFALTRRAIELCSLFPGNRVLDVGCGTGASVDYLRRVFGLAAVGVDRSRAALARGRGQGLNVPIGQGSGECLPIASSSVDVVLAECSCSIMARRGEALAEFHRVLAPGGRLVVSDLYARNPVASCDFPRSASGCLSGLMTREELALELERHGFSLTAWEDHSRALKEFMIRAILEHGSFSSFWELQGGHRQEAAQVQRELKRARPGYFLLVARKTAMQRDTRRPPQ